ncbi:MAG: hypothetical protein ACFFE8_17475, partial [Candidatus Heimdallarchaeota archaeon]
PISEIQKTVQEGLKKSEGFGYPGDEETPFPYIYRFPYPKGPPMPSGERIALRKLKAMEEEPKERIQDDIIPHKKVVEEEFSDEDDRSNS